MLHYYADRAVTSRTLRPERLGDTHKLIDRHLESESPVDISMHGYVISLQGAAGFPARHRQVPITVLTANDLGAAGFTTKFDEPASNLDDETPSEKPTGNDQPAPASSRGSITSDEDTPADPLPAPAADPSAREGTSADATAGPPPVTDPGRADRSVGPGTESSQPDLAPTTRVPLHSPPPSTENTGERGDPGPDPNDATRHQETPGPEAASDNNPGASSTRTVEVLLGRDAHGADVRWPVSTQGSPHAFVLGIPGQGKSVTTRRIVSDFSEAGLPSLLLDFHGDMAAEPPAGATVVDASLGLPFSPFETVDTTGAAMNVVAFETAEVVAYVADLGGDSTSPRLQRTPAGLHQDRRGQRVRCANGRRVRGSTGGGRGSGERQTRTRAGPAAYRLRAVQNNSPRKFRPPRRRHGHRRQPDPPTPSTARSRSLPPATHLPRHVLLATRWHPQARHRPR